MKFRYLFLLPLLFITSSWADFSSSDYGIHPWYMEFNEPFIIEIVGDWPTDCHPGEQKPVVTEYTGDTALVEFETIVDHRTCNDVVTPYRVLVDMSDVVGSLEGEFLRVDVTVRLGGDELKVEVPHPCAHLCSPSPLPRDIKPESGLYHSADLEKQGLLLARQGKRLAAYPLIYDESGSSEWLFAGDGIKENVYFADLYELTGGQCLGCPPPADTTQLNVVGKISMLTDSEGRVQVKVNDGLFVPYEQSEFGYGSIDIGGAPNQKVPGLSGRWAFIDDSPLEPGQPTPEVDPLLPFVFDIRRETFDVYPPPIISPFPAGEVSYSIRDKAGNKFATMLCSAQGAVRDAEMVCEVRNPEVNNGGRLYEVRASSIERLSFTWAGPRPTTPPPDYSFEPRTAVRID